MATERSAIQRAARTIVLGLGALLLLYHLAAPLAHYAAIVAAGLLLAVALSSPAGWLSKRTKLPYRAAVALVVTVLLGVIVAFFAWTGPLIATQVEDLDEAVRDGIERARAWLTTTPFGRGIGERIDEASGELGDPSDMLGSVQRGLARGVSVIADIAIVIFVGLFVAFGPSQYFEGALHLVPPERRPRLREVGRSAIHTLRVWLGARLILMTAIGVTFGIGLAILGVPLALPLGVLAGMLAFIPYLGPVLTLIPAIAVAFVDGPDLALKVLALYAALQVVESNVLEPLVEARAVHLPPALVLLAQVLAVVWFGAIGVLIATPLLVVVVVAVRMLYVEDRLGDHTVEADDGTRPDEPEPPRRVTAAPREAPT